MLRDLGPAAFAVAVERSDAARTGDEGLRERAAFYARCLAVEDLAYGLGADRPRYAEAAAAALGRLLG